MSSSADAIQLRRARWPWVILAGFLIVAVGAMALVVANDESLGAQIPFVVAFAMFGVVGALIVSRDRGNTIGLMLPVGLVLDGARVRGRGAPHASRV